MVHLQRIRIRLLALGLALGLAVQLLASGCGTAPPPAQKLKLALTPTLYTGLVAIADKLGYFRDAGLELDMQEFPSGLLSVESLGRGEFQLALAAEFVLAGKTRDVPDARIVASIAVFDTVDIVARKDLGIHRPEDLRGRRVATSFGTVGQYFLNSFLLLHAIAPESVTILDIHPSKQVAALLNDEVDAICIWDTFAWEARHKLGDKGVFWPAQNSQGVHWVLITREPPGKDEESVRRFLRALLRAQEYHLGHVEESRRIIAARWPKEAAYMAGYWDRVRLSVTMDQSLAASLENAYRWILRQRGQETASTDIMDRLDPAPLQTVDARLVTLYR